MTETIAQFSKSSVQPCPKNSPWRPDLEEFLKEPADWSGQLSRIEANPRLELSQKPGDGSASEQACRASEMEHEDNNLFVINTSASITTGDAYASSPVTLPSEERLEDPTKNILSATERTARKPPATVFLVSDQEGLDQDPTKWTRLSRFQHDVGPDYSDRNRKSRLIQRDDKYRRCTSVLQRIEIPYPERQYAINRTMAEDARGFNRHQGIEGAVIGFGLYALYTGPEEAQDSVHADLAIDLVPGFSERAIRQLTEYVFSKEGGSR